MCQVAHFGGTTPVFSKKNKESHDLPIPSEYILSDCNFKLKLNVSIFNLVEPN